MIRDKSRISGGQLVFKGSGSAPEERYRRRGECVICFGMRVFIEAIRDRIFRGKIARQKNGVFEGHDDDDFGFQ